MVPYFSRWDFVRAWGFSMVRITSDFGARFEFIFQEVKYSCGLGVVHNLNRTVGEKVAKIRAEVVICVL